MISLSATINSKRSPMSSDFSASSQPDQTTTRSALLVAATGLGKTAMMAGLARNWPTGRVMVVSHRFELNQQAIGELERICGEDVDLEQADYHADMRSDRHRIVVASVQTLNSRRKGRTRMQKFRPSDFGLLMVDEAHRAAARSYRRVFEYFKQNPNLRIVGVTATPDRLDGVGLGRVFNVAASDLNILWGVESGWLCEPVQKFVRVDGLDLSEVRTVAGDLDKKQLARLVEIEENLHAMAKPIVDVCGRDKQAIVFAASVRQAHRLAELIRDYRFRTFGECGMEAAVSLDGTLSPQDPRRRSIVRSFKDGRIQYLVNMGVATEGFDAPNVRVIAIGRPTKSRSLFTQMVGRGGRPLPGVVDNLPTAGERRAAIYASDKPHFTVLDFVGQASRHHLVCTADILAGDAPEEVIERAAEIMRNSQTTRATLDALREAREQLEAEREAKRAKLTVGVDYELVDQRSAYDLSRIPEVRCPGYLQRKGPTDKQRNVLLKLGYTSAQVDGMNPRSASAAIDYAIRHPKNGYARWWKMKKMGR